MEENSLTVGRWNHKTREWETTPTSPTAGLLKEGKRKINLG